MAVGKGGQGECQSPPLFPGGKYFFHVKSENIKSLHVINICDFGLFIKQDISDKK